uniref:DUF2281 domain-containing protein n=2 Tax=Bursaphelenchus xylophilus TaxID=6326 RepID=A0A1I7SNZ5_BURXY
MPATARSVHLREFLAARHLFPPEEANPLTRRSIDISDLEDALETELK